MVITNDDDGNGSPVGRVVVGAGGDDGDRVRVVLS